jgi:PAS domain S-box-containing protein
MAEKDAHAHFWFMERRYFSLIIVLLFVILVTVTFFLCYRHNTINTEQILINDRLTANLLSVVLDERLKKIVSVMESYAQRPLLLQAARDKNVEKASYHLVDLVKRNPDIDIVIISDRWGTPWAASYPGLSPVIGKNFAHRDWYKGVSKEWKPYITDVVLRVVQEQDLAVQISVPCFNERGEVVGILVNTQRTVGLNNLLKQAILDPGAFITVTDLKSQIVYTSRYDVGKKISPYPFHPGMKKAMAAKNITFTVDDPDLGRGTRYISFAPVANIGWTVFVERDKRSIFLSGATYYIQATAIAFLLFLSLIFFLAFSRKQVTARQLLEQLQAEKIIRAGEEKLRFLSSRQDAILAAVPEVIMEVDHNKVYTWANSVGIEFFGEDVIGKEAAFYFEGEQDTYDIVNPLFSGSEEVIYVESWQRRKNGEKRLLAWWCRTLKNENGQVIGALSSARDITDRKRAEEELQATKIQLVNALEIAHLGPWEYDVANDIFTFNDQFYKIFRTTAEQCGGYTMHSAAYARRFIHPDDMYMVGEETRKAIETADPNFNRQIEHRMLYADGTIGHISVRFFIAKDSHGTTVKTYGVNQDITERKQVEEKILLLNERISTATRSAQVGIWDWDVVNNRLEWDDQMYALYGQNREEFAGAYEAWLKGLHPDDRASCDEESRRALRGEKEYDTEFRVVWSDGSIHFIKANGDVFRDADGKPLRMIGVNYDITDRKQAEDELKRSESRFRSYFDLQLHGIAITSLEKGWIEVNDRLCSILGYTREEIVQKTWSEMTYPDDLAADIEQFSLVLSGKIEQYNMEKRFIHKAGAIIWTDLSVGCVRKSDGTVDYFVALIEDITEYKRLAKGRLDMERQVLHSQKLESLGVLAGGIAHDFNNLLMAILGNLELAMEEISPVSSARPYLENSHKASRRAADLTRQMLAYSGKGRFVVENMNLSELVQENIHMFRSSVSPSIDLTLHLTKDIQPVMADAGQIQQVVMNLITNAAEAIGDKAGSVSITIGVQTCDEACLKLSSLQEKPAPGDFVYLEVRDTGCGMDEETQQKIFDPFFTTKFTGRGLGMSALQGIILGHKGAIFLDSTSGGGTTIRVIFPVSDTIQYTAEPVTVTMEVPLAPDTSSLPGIVLIVDDEDDVRQICSAMVGLIGYRTLTAEDGQEAVEVFRNHVKEVACVILDMTMPKMDGYTTFQTLRQIRPDINVIISSGYNEQDVTQRFTGLGLAGFIQKPYRRQQLQDELKRVMAGGERK